MIDTGAVPVERVWVGKQNVTKQQTVRGDVRKEQMRSTTPNCPSAEHRVSARP